MDNHKPNLAQKAVLGVRGEELATNYLLRNGFELVMQNFKAPIGRNRKGTQISGEIDIIALDGDVVCFIEVKARKSESEVDAISAVDLRKQRQITRTAREYRRIFGVNNEIRFDVIAVIPNKNRAPLIRHLRGFWSEEKFQKRRWLEGGYQPSF
ncbi:MAG: YraN family protein [Pyrinomonadaceae bacterium]